MFFFQFCHWASRELEQIHWFSHRYKEKTPFRSNSRFLCSKQLLGDVSLPSRFRRCFCKGSIRTFIRVQGIFYLPHSTIKKRNLGSERNKTDQIGLLTIFLVGRFFFFTHVQENACKKAICLHLFMRYVRCFSKRCRYIFFNLQSRLKTA